MPFTFSHPAIIIPFTFFPRNWFSVSGLIIGSVVPDFEYFLRMRVQSNYSHTFYGVFWFNLPFGIILAFVFHNYIKNSLIDNLPTILNLRFFRYKQFEWTNYFKKDWMIVIISILIGVFSHLLWDSFTHSDGYFVTKLFFLNNTFSVYGLKIAVFKLLQHSSTLIGGIFILISLFKLPKEKFSKELRTSKLKYWFIYFLIAFTIIFIRTLVSIDVRIIGHFIATMISAMLISLILTPIFLKLTIKNL